MEKLEKVELLRSKTGATYEQAKDALEKCNEDVLDAIVYLEKNGAIKNGSTAQYTTNQENSSQAFEKAQQNYEKSCKNDSASAIAHKIVRGMKELLVKSCETNFEVSKDGKKLLSVPVLVLIIVFIVLQVVTIVALIVGLFCDCKYSFVGTKGGAKEINDVCEKASEACVNLKKELNSEEN